MSILGIGLLKAQRLQKDISLKEVLETALSNNSSVKISALEEEISTSQYKESNATFLPQVNLSFTSTLSNNPLVVFGNKMMQANVLAADFNPADLNNPGDYQNHNAMINVMQPLINADMLFQRRATSMQREIYKHRTDRTKAYVNFEVKKTYNQLYLEYEVVAVLKQTIEASKSANEKVSNFYNQGLVKKSDYLNAQVYQASMESQLAEELSTIEYLSDQLSLLMGAEQAVTYTVHKDDVDPLAVQSATSFNENRSDFLAYKKSIESSDKMVQASLSSMLPKVNAFGNYQYNSKTFGFGANSYLVGVQLSWDIFKGTSSAYKVSTQKYLKEKMEQEYNKEKEQAKLEIEKTNRAMEVSKGRIAQLKLSVEQAEESMKLTKDRYDVGLMSTTDLLMSLTQLSQQKLMLSKVYFEYQVNQSYLEFLHQ